MTTPRKFTRQRAIALTGADSNRLSYLDRQGLVVPEKFGNPKRPVVLYSEMQLLQITAAQKVSLRPKDLRNFLDSFPDPIDPFLGVGVYLVDGTPVWATSFLGCWEEVARMLGRKGSAIVQVVALAPVWEQMQKAIEDLCEVTL